VAPILLVFLRINYHIVCIFLLCSTSRLHWRKKWRRRQALKISGWTPYMTVHPHFKHWLPDNECIAEWTLTYVNPARTKKQHMCAEKTFYRPLALLTYESDSIPEAPYRLKPCPHCRRKWDCRRKVRLSPKTARQRRNSATVATVSLFCDKLSHFSATVWTGFYSLESGSCFVSW